jgi:hypothetical protein
MYFRVRYKEPVRLMSSYFGAFRPGGRYNICAHPPPRHFGIYIYLFLLNNNDWEEEDKKERKRVIQRYSLGVAAKFTARPIDFASDSPTQTENNEKNLAFVFGFLGISGEFLFFFCFVSFLFLPRLCRKSHIRDVTIHPCKTKMPNFSSLFFFPRGKKEINFILFYRYQSISFYFVVVVVVVAV